MGYIASVLALTVLLPIVSALADCALHHLAPALAGLKWLTFWACGVRLLLAGLRQSARPDFTARAIFQISGNEVLPVVRELGFANLAMGLLGTLSLLVAGLVDAAAIVGGVYYLLAGVQHALHRPLNAKRKVAMITDLLVGSALGLLLALTP